MEGDKGNILQDFDRAELKLKECGRDIEQLLEKLLKRRGAKPHQLTHRVKDRYSLEKKLARKNYKYSSLDELTDLIGVRVITYFEDDIDIIAGIINDEFLIDYENSIDKRKVEPEKFGYRSLHYVFSIKPERAAMAEYENLANVKVEIQIRSILQHSWAEIEHDLGYKGANEIPDTARRTFYRVAALLEQADIEFVKLKNEIEQYEKEMPQRIAENAAAVKVDKASVISFINKNAILAKIEDDFAKKFKLNVVPSDDIMGGLLPTILSEYGIDTVEKLIESYRIHMKEIEDQGEASYDRNPEYYKKDRSILKGSSLLWLCDFLNEERFS